MKFLKTGLIVVGSAALILLTAFDNTVQATNATNKPHDFLAQIAAQNSSTAPTLIAATGHSKESKGGQVVESEGASHFGKYIKLKVDR